MHGQEHAISITLDTIYRSKYEADAFLISLQIKNNLDRTVYLKRKDEQLAIIANGYENNKSDYVNIPLDGCNAESIKAKIVGSYISGSREASKYYEHFLRENNKVSQRRKFKLLPQKTIKIHEIWFLSDDDMARLELVKQQCKETPRIYRAYIPMYYFQRGKKEQRISAKMTSEMFNVMLD